jgi:hypothetical protein
VTVLLLLSGPLGPLFTARNALGDSNETVLKPMQSLLCRQACSDGCVEWLHRERIAQA